MFGEYKQTKKFQNFEENSKISQKNTQGAIDKF